MNDSSVIEDGGNLTKRISQVFSALKSGPISSFQLRFKDRQYAANILAATIQDRLGKDLKQKENITILGIPRGGVVVAKAVAKRLIIKNFDIVIPRKLTDIDNKEQAIGAIMADGTTYLDEKLVSDLLIHSKYIEAEKKIQLKEIERRRTVYRKVDSNYDSLINNKTVIVIDDGAASGATVIVVARWLKQKYNATRIILAVPVVPKQTMILLEKEYDKVISVTTPSKYFHFVGQYYKSFPPVTDTEVINLTQDIIS